MKVSKYIKYYSTLTILQLVAGKKYICKTMSICNIGYNVSLRKSQTSHFRRLKVILCYDMSVSIYITN